MRVHSHPFLPSQLAAFAAPLIYLCYIFLSFLSLSHAFHRVFDVLPFSFRLSIRCLTRTASALRRLSSLASATPSPFPVCATQGQPLPLSRTHACMLSYLSVHEHSLICHCIISSRSLCALRKPHTFDTRCRCLRSSSLESTVRLSYSGFGSTFRSLSTLSVTLRTAAAMSEQQHSASALVAAVVAAPLRLRSRWSPPTRRRRTAAGAGDAAASAAAATAAAAAGSTAGGNAGTGAGARRRSRPQSTPSLPKIGAPSQFKGEMGFAVDDWICELEQQFAYYNRAFPDDASRIKFAVAYLHGPAVHWWDKERPRPSSA